MSTNTTRLGLTKPSGSASPAEAVDVGVLNTNADLIDQWMGCILVNDGVTPATGSLFDGAIVKEKTSGIIWEARKNGGGTFDKVYVRYPYLFIAYNIGVGLQSVASGTTMGACTAVSTYISGKNSSSGHLSSNKWVCPVKGIYEVQLHIQWTTNGAGRRTFGLWLNGADGGFQYEQTIVGSSSSGSGLHQRLSFVAEFSVGNTVSAAVWQDSGGNLNIDQGAIRVAMIEPTQ